jgi:uncharacterized cupredoxin-like copper-binding protein
LDVLAKDTEEKMFNKRFNKQAVSLLAGLTMGFGFAQAHDAMYNFDGTTLSGPETMEAGYHTLMLENNAGAPSTLYIFQVKEGFSAEDVQTAWDNVNTSFIGQGDPNAAINELLEVANVLSGPLSEPSTSSEIGLEFTPGNYLLIGEARGEEGPQQGTLNLTVSEAAAATAAPEADVNVVMADFAFAIPGEIKSGEQLWKVTNEGQQIHHMVIMKPHKGKTVDDILAYDPSTGGEEPATEIGIIEVMTNGESAYKMMNLEPGDYIAICFMPDHAAGGDGAPHFVHGMVQNFTVVVQ